ncbi:MAG: hypothetical protein HDR06_17955 [Lachnospiraceae bacterium]|nr:hypothetical protein [Lachnospiraceae bacterium]
MKVLNSYVRIIFNENEKFKGLYIIMKKQLEGQLSLFDYISEDEKKNFSNDKQSDSEKNNKSTESDNLISFYQECTLCWCSTCRHNKKGQAVPRDFAGEKKPCPSCDFCIKQKKAEICEIGSYENGCKLRAKEEGIVLE